jgi:DNA (cytosine-5)-methyltransferase 1
MKFASVCSGIEAASVAWKPLGWKPVFVSEIEKFPSAVLAQRHPETPNLGDMTQFKKWNDYAGIDVVVGGTPCQSFSVAGLRKGLDDPRGNLTLTYLGVIERYRPTWVVWENVPGVLSDKTGAFGSFLGGLGQLGYGFAYRVLDAQYYGVAQRRRRVFVVGCAGGQWQRAAAVLFERESLLGNNPPRREAGKRVAAAPGTGAEGDGGPGDVSRPLRGQAQPAHREDADNYVVDDTSATVNAKWAKSSGGHAGYEEYNLTVAGCLDANYAKHFGQDNQHVDAGCPLFVNKGVTHALKAEGHDGSEDGTVRGVPLVTAIQSVNTPAEKKQNGVGVSEDGAMYTLTNRDQHAVAFDTTQVTSKENRSNPKPDDPCHPLAAGAHAPAVAFQPRYYTRGGKPSGKADDICNTLTNQTKSGDGHPHVAFAEVADPIAANQANTWTREGKNFRMSNVAHSHSMVRRLTPRECERLQGFPDDYTLITTGGKPAADGPRYKALGNSMAVPVMRWIGERIAAVSKIK